MLDCVMLSQNRPSLLNQALESLVANTSGEWRLVVVDDNSAEETQQLLAQWTEHLGNKRMGWVHNIASMGPGVSRNIGIDISEQWWGRGDYLYLCDNDCYFKPGWDRVLTEAFAKGQDFNFRVLGGYVHPYNQTTTSILVDGVELHEKYAVGLLSWLMRWETWEAHGPFDPSPSANGSEDWAFCHKIRLAGGRVGCVWPWVVCNTGMTGASGKLSPGSELIFRQPDLPEGLVIL